MLLYYEGIRHYIISQLGLTPMVVPRFRPVDFFSLGLRKNLGVIVGSAPIARVPRPIKDTCPLVFFDRPAFRESGHNPACAVGSYPSIGKDIAPNVGVPVVFGAARQAQAKPNRRQGPHERP